MLNTLILAGLTITGNLFSCTYVAYGFSRIRWKGRNALFLVVLATMLLPQHVTIVPLFITYRKLGLIGGGYKGYLPLILPSWFGEAFFIFMVRQFFLGIPFELTDAARIDGCSELGILWRIIVPLSKPVLIAVALFSMIRVWGDFFGQLIYLQDREFYTISVGLAQFQGRFMTQWNQAMAASAMAVVPILIVFVFAQRQFVQGISLTGLK
jgi:multiple sugar transport system permease protein